MVPLYFLFIKTNGSREQWWLASPNANGFHNAWNDTVWCRVGGNTKSSNVDVSYAYGYPE
jgi:hypothetical protein